MTVATSGDYGKPRPALVVQADAHAEHPSTTVLPLTSELHAAPLLRITVEPGGSNGLRLRSQVVVDKITTIPRAKVGNRIGRLDDATLDAVDRALAAFLGLGGPEMAACPNPGRPKPASSCSATSSSSTGIFTVPASPGNPTGRSTPLGTT